MDEKSLHILAVSAGNSTVRSGLYKGTELVESVLAPAADPTNAVGTIARLAQASDSDPPSIVIGASNGALAAELVDRLNDASIAEVFRVGADLSIPIKHALETPETTGEDRFLNALGAYRLASQACVVVDAGTAITVDFVDGEGTFHGGAILTGAQMGLDALHQHTSALPQLTIERPDDEHFARSTKQAMLHGTYYGIRGMVRHLVERYAEAYAAYPSVIATGGDAALLFDGDELIERVVPDLTLRGIVASCAEAMESSHASQPDGE